jgi:flagellar protein FlaG
MSGEVVTQLNLETHSQAGTHGTKVAAVKPVNEVRQVIAGHGESNTPPDSQASAPSDALLTRAVSDINEYVQNVQRDLRFSIDEDSGHTVITVLDSETEEVIRQIPAEEVLAIARNLEAMKGLLFDDQA